MAKTTSKVIARKMPQSYEVTPHQLLFKRIAEECGIKKGITHAELVDKMQHCVPDAWKKVKEEQNAPPLGQPQSSPPQADG